MKGTQSVDRDTLYTGPRSPLIRGYRSHSSRWKLAAMIVAGILGGGVLFFAAIGFWSVL